MKAPLRTKPIGTKVSEGEFATLEATARAADMTLSEWVRAVLLSAPGLELPDDEAALAGRAGAGTPNQRSKSFAVNLFRRRPVSLKENDTQIGAESDLHHASCSLL
jgi:hypothetical protein